MTITAVKDAGTGSLEVTLADGTVLFVPSDPANTDYVRVQAWVAAGGVIA